MSLLQKPSLNCQGFSIYQSVSPFKISKIQSTLLKLSETRLRLTLIVLENPNIQAKEAGKKVHLDKNKTLQYLKELASDGWLNMVQLSPRNSARSGIYS